MTTIQRLQNGELPTDILYELKKEFPDKRNPFLAYKFSEDIEQMPGAALLTIWHWKNGSKKDGLVDEVVNEIVLEHLSDAGLL